MRARSLPLLLLTVSCVDPAVVDPNTRILCSTDDDCPPAWACRDLGSETRCLPQELAADSTPPVVESFSAPAVARADFDFELVVSEPVLALDLSFAGAPVAVEVEPTGLAYTVGLSVDALPDGVHTISVDATDRAGNPMEAPLLVEVAVDQSAPSVLNPPLLDGQVFTADRVATVSLVFSEPVRAAAGGEPKVLADNGVDPPLEFSALQVDELGAAFTYTFVFAAETPQGLYEVRVDPFVDAAGNTAAAVELGTLGVDTRPPSLIEVPEVPCSLARFDNFQITADDVELSFDFCVDEPVDAAGLLVRLDGAVDDAAIITPLTEPGVNAFRYTSAVPAEVSGSFTVELVMEDPAGNVNSEVLGLVSVDSAPPAVVSVFFAPDTAAANLGFLEITVIADELLEPLDPLGTPPHALVLSEALDAELISVVNATARFRVSGPGLPDGLTVSEITLVDVAGNVGVHAPGAFTSPVLSIDDDPPALTVTVSGGTDVDGTQFYKNGQSVTFDLRSDDLDIASVSVTVGPRVLQCDVVTLECSTLVIDENVAEGPLAVLVSAVDAVGNLGTVLTDIVVDRVGPQPLTPIDNILDLTPPAKSYSTSVTSVTTGTGLSANFVTDEPLSTTSPPRLTQGNLSVDCNRLSDTVVSCARLVVDEPSAEANLVLRDRSGNDSTVTLPLIEDTTPPAPPDLSALIHRRAPWGTRGDPAPSFVVDNVPDGVVGPENVTLFFFANEFATGEPLTSMRALAGRGLSQPAVIPADHPRLFVVAEDDAGNQTPANGKTPLPSVEWTATLRGKSPGSVLENPHLSFAVPFVDDTVNPGFVENGATERGDKAPSPIDYRPRWVEVKRDRPSARQGAAMAFDPARRRVVLFGGESSTLERFGDTWTWSGRSWTQVPAFGPPARTGAAMTFDPTRGQVLLFGGDGLVDLWAFTGDSWQQLNLPGMPSVFADPGLVFEEETGKVHALVRDLTTLNVCTLELAGWSCLPMPLGEGPQGELGSSIALPGGGILAASTTGVFRYDAGLGTWTAEAEPPGGLNPRGGLVRDGLETLLIEGGSLAGGARVLRYTNPGWEELDADGAIVDSNFALAHDGRSVIRFGGEGDFGTETVSDLLIRFRGGDFERVSFERPSPRFGAADAPGLTDGTWALFGGSAGGLALNDLWILDANGFTELKGNDAPPGRSFASLGRTKTVGGSQLVLFGGEGGLATNPLHLDDTWVFENGNWVEALIVSRPEARSKASMAPFGAQQDRLILFGGQNAAGDRLSSPFEFDGVTWSPGSRVDEPGPISGARMVFDPDTDEALLIGGEHDNGFSTPGNVARFLYDGARWAIVGDGEPRALHGLVRHGGEYLAFGGLLLPSAGFTPAQLVRLPTSGVINVSVANEPFPRRSMVFGVVDGEPFAFGGQVGGAASDDLFFLEGIDGGRSAVQYVIDLRAAGLPSHIALVDRVEINAGASGTGPLLQAWSPATASWCQIADATAGEGAPVEIVYDRFNGEPCGPLIVGDKIFVRVVPRDPGDRDNPAVVAANLIEVRVSLQAPP